MSRGASIPRRRERMTSAWLSHAPQTDVEITKVVAGTASKILLAVVAELGRLDTGLAGRGGNDVMLEFLGSTPKSATR